MVRLSSTACFVKEYPHGTAERILDRMIDQLEKVRDALRRFYDVRPTKTSHKTTIRRPIFTPYERSTLFARFARYPLITYPFC